ncbi:MAG: iron ABC transporter permease [Melioribacteraceae bacterium]|nr:iron ABC transporter permease [Melioribacteraceae bacterium]MCF8354782.1 iron ABC transporter permease [Melioribacteraceae bacterium]MCF8393324.1 iron ABC transporter permease [Melioribacteraceae bacterium]MCF8419176.1 iron ABC transporter permease [Melioribacteraceae bacterium]
MENAERLSKVKYFLYLSILFIIMILSVLISIFIGSVDISFQQIFTGLFHPSDSVVSQIIWDIRLPRILLAIAVGGGLSVTGAVFQAILLNPLAEPYILGISSGGTFGAILSFLIGLSFFSTQIFAFAGALLVVALVFILGRRFGELDPNVLLLTGVMIGAFFSAAILLMITMLNESLRTAIFWLVGNLSLADRNSVYYILPVSVIISIFLSANGYKYNVLSMGSETAKHLGINVNRFKNVVYILSSLLIGAVVSVSGIVGFVGLLVPHATRLIFGVDNRIVVPASFFIGAAYLTFADTAARTVIAPAEIPVGAVTAIIGAPIFIYLLRKRFQVMN